MREFFPHFFIYFNIKNSLVENIKRSVLVKVRTSAITLSSLKCEE